jgi:hypothetical protein
MALSRRTKGAVVASVATVIVGVLAAVLWHRRGAEPQQIAPGLALELATTAAPVIEAQLTAEWFVGKPGQRMACAVRPIGTAPDSAETLAAVETVYVWSLCASVGTEVRSALSGPMAVRLVAPPSAESPGDGAAYATDVKRIFPERLHDAVLGNVQVHDLEAPLKERIAELS